MSEVAIAQYQPQEWFSEGYVKEQRPFPTQESNVNITLQELIPLWKGTSSIVVILRPEASSPRFEGLKVVEKDVVQVGVKDIVERFGLNKSQAANIFRVTRQSIYDWITSNQALKPANQARLEKVIIALGCVSEDDAPILGRVLKYRVVGGKEKLQDFLCSDEIDPAAFSDAYQTMSKTFAQQRAIAINKPARSSLSSSDEYKFLST